MIAHPPCTLRKSESDGSMEAGTKRDRSDGNR
jgi:hypothetical protein